MKVTLQKKGNTGLVWLCGELDEHTAQSAREQIDNFIKGGKINRLIFDLGKLSFMDSSGIGVILGRYKLIQKQGGQVCVKNCTPRVDKIFVMSGLYKIINKLD